MNSFPHSPTTLTIDLDAIVENWRILKGRTFHGRSAAVVKANGYGLGLAPVGRALSNAGCDTFFVAHLDEGIALREVLSEKPDTRIFVMNGLLPTEPDVYIAHGLVPCLNDLGQIDRWRDVCGSKGSPLPAVLHVDTGMSRTGLDRRELAQLADDPGRLSGIDLRFIMSHMACADEPSHPMNADQRDRFGDILTRLPKTAEGGMLAASSATFLGPEWHFDWIRPGVCLYGVRPNREIENPMRPVVRLEARILQVRQIDAPESVGYGASHRVAGPTRIATLAVGYADGFLRALSNSAKAWVGEVEVPVVGRVSMDLITIDVSLLPQVGPGDTVSLIGANQDVDALADGAGTIGYEILTSLGARYARHYVGGRIVNPVRALGAAFLRFLAATGRLTLFALNGVGHCVRPPIYPRLIVRQMVDIGYYSLPVVGLTTLFAGMVLALQSYTGFARFSAEGAIPSVVVLSITRELSPVLAGLMIAGRIGAAMAAELGTMRVTEQVDALETLSTNPMKYLIAPRLIAGVSMLPFLVFIGDIMGVFGGFIVSVYKLGFNEQAYLINTWNFLEFQDVFSGLVKAAVFGFLVALMGCYHGFHSRGGAQGVGAATTNAVVSASILILIANYLITEMFFAQ